MLKQLFGSSNNYTGRVCMHLTMVFNFKNIKLALKFLENEEVSRTSSDATNNYMTLNPFILEIKPINDIEMKGFNVM